MLKFLTLASKNKYIKICLSFVLCFILIFNIISVSAEPVHALALETAILFVLASLCFSMSISIAASPPDWGDTFQPLYDSLSSGCQEWINDAARGVGLGYAYVFEWTPQQYAQLTTEILNYFHTASSATSFGMVTPSRADSKIGYASGYGFSLSYPDSVSCSYALPNSILTLYDRYNYSDHPYPYISSSFNRGFVVTNNDGFGYMSFSYYGSAGHWYNTTFSVSRYYDGSYGSYLRNNSTYDSTFQMPFSQNVMNQSGNYFFDSDGFFYKYKEVNGRICFVDVADSTHIYNNLSFSGKPALCDWFLNSCGLVTDSYSTALPYESPVADIGVDYDDSSASSARSLNVDYAEENGSLPMVIPATDSDLITLVESPELVTDVSTASETMTISTPDNYQYLSFSSILDFLSNFWDNLVRLFIPPPDFWGDGLFLPLFTAIENKFTFLAGLENWMNYFSEVGGQGISFSVCLDFLLGFFRLLNIPVPSGVQDSYTLVVDFAFYEPYRLNIRALLSVVIAVLSTLKCLRLLTHAFNLPIVNESISQSSGVTK